MSKSSKSTQSKPKATSSSLPEELSSFFGDKYKFSAEVQENIKKQEISGDILLSLNDTDFKALGLKLGPIKKLKKYISENKSDFPEKEIDIKITKNSTKEEVKEFLENIIGIKEGMDLDGKSLLELKNEDIIKLGLTLGKRKKLEKYLKYFNSLKPEEKEEEKEEDKKEEETKDKNEIKDENEGEQDKEKKEQNENEINTENNKKTDENEIKIEQEKEKVEESPKIIMKNNY